MKALRMFASKSLGLRSALSASLVSLVLTMVPVLPSNADEAAATTSDRFNKYGKQAAELLSKLIQFDTTNPPGDEKKAAQFLADILNSHGIETKLIDVTPTRACVYGRLKGTAKKKAIVLLNHLDVVPARAEDWKYPPFAGEIHDGELWGRGAQDMKGMGIVELVALLALKEEGKQLDRDIIFLATPDEELGGEKGAQWFKEHQADLVKDAEFLINEGFHIGCDSKGVQEYWGVDVAEKSALWLKLVTKGDAGHASMPIPDSAPNRLVRALQKIVNAPAEPRVIPSTKEYFYQLSKTQEQPLKEQYADIENAVKDKSFMDSLLKDKEKSAMLLNTVSLTILKAGYKTNVIPAEAEATIDCRLLPDQDHHQFIEKLKGIIQDPSVDFSIIQYQNAKPSSFDSDLFKAIASVAAQEAKEIGLPLPVVPVLVPWFTDAHWFRDLGLTCYGFIPFEVDTEHNATMHGKNERIQLSVLSHGTERMYKILLKLAGSN